MRGDTVIVQSCRLVDEVGRSATLPWNERPSAVAYLGSISERRGIRGILQALALFPSDRSVQMMLAGSFSREGLRTELERLPGWGRDRKSTRLNSSHQIISYAVFCLKKKKSKSPLLSFF